MTPLKLTVSAFGSYTEKTVIDLTLLGKSGIYLITGDTGSGKTTIFDALTYSLFGSGSGEFRDRGEMFRCKYAANDTETFTELEFLCHGKQYKIRRNPKYLRPKKRGVGLAEEKASDTLWLPDGRILTNRSEVDNFINELLGMNREQFSQIVMLPQGNFMKFLMADTSEKERIFKEIFKTHIYKKIQESVRIKTKALEDSLKASKQELLQAVGRIVCSDENEDHGYIDSIKQDAEKGLEIQADTVAEKTEKIIFEHKKILDTQKKELEAINIKTEHISNLLGVHKANECLKEKILSEQSKLKTNNELLKEYMTKLSAASENAKVCPDLAIDIQRLSSQLPEYEKRENLIKKAENSKKLANEYTLKIEKLKKIILDKNEELKKIIEEINSLYISEDELIDLNSQKSDVEHKIILLKNALKRIDEIKAADIEYQREQKKFCSLIEAYREQSELFIDKEKLYDSAAAGRLSSKLLEGLPCPVCGSTEHPSPAKEHDDTPSEQELKELKKALDEKQRLKDSQREKVILLESKKNTLTEHLFNEYKEFIDNEVSTPKQASITLTDKLEENEKLFCSINSRLLEIQKSKTRQKLLSKKKAETEECISKYKEEIQELEKLYSEEIRQADIFKTKADSIKLDCSDLVSAKKQTEQLIKRKADLEKAMTEAQKAYDSLLRRIRESETIIASSEEQLKKAPDKTVSELQNELEKLRIKRDEITSILSKTEHMLITNTQSLKTIKKCIKETGEKNESFKLIKELSDLLNGTIKFRDIEQITLEVRVQMMYFDRILSGANPDLLRMTNGQYEFVRSKSSSDGRKKSGLEINVIDHFCQLERNVKTLSGGESFKASLALALSMAKEIQHNSGGIQIDTLFIDEGFGSLDDESLDQAVDTLAGLAQNNRLIGIISHVNELKNRIEKKIIVTKDGASGSRIRIEA